MEDVMTDDQVNGYLRWYAQLVEQANKTLEGLTPEELQKVESEAFEFVWGQK